MGTAHDYRYKRKPRAQTEVEPAANADLSGSSEFIFVLCCQKYIKLHILSVIYSNVYFQANLLILVNYYEK